MEPSSLFFRHCDKATLEPKLGDIKGSIPTWLEGTLTRNGGGIRRVGQEEYFHLFDGLAIIHRFHIQNGQVTYNSRPLESEAYLKAKAAERIVMTEFGTLGIEDPCESIFGRLKTVFDPFGKGLDDNMTDNCLANVGYYGDELYAMTETVFSRRIDPVTLRTIGEKSRIADYVAVNQATAHPHVLPDGTILNMGSNYRNKMGTRYCIIRVPPPVSSTKSNDSVFKDAKIVAEIPASSKLYPSYYHSFGMTSDKIVFIEQPFCISIPRVLLYKTGIWRTAIKDWLFWMPNHNTKFHLVNWKTGENFPTIFETKDLFTLHHVNAYEENEQLIVDVVGYNNANFVAKIGEADFESDHFHTVRLRRYILPLNCSSTNINGNRSSSVEVQPTVLCEIPFEFPRINYKFNSVKYQFVYGAGLDPQGPMSRDPNSIIKVNVTNRKVLIWKGGESVVVSEPVFVANPSKKNSDEDDGVILTVLLHKGFPLKTTLAIIEAKSMELMASVEFEADGVVTAGLHGQWGETKANRVFK